MTSHPSSHRATDTIPDSIMICCCDASDALGIYILEWRLRKMYAGFLPKSEFRSLLNRFPDTQLILSTRDREDVEWARRLGRVPIVKVFLYVDCDPVPDGEINTLQFAERLMRKKINVLSAGKVPIDYAYDKPRPLPIMKWEEVWMDWINWEEI